MRRLVVVCLGLLLGLLAGLTLRPDDGTPVSISPTETGAVVSGANHGKPLPRVPDVRALLGDLAALSGVAAIALVLVPSWKGSDVTAVEGVVAGELGQLGAQALGVVVLWTVIFGIAYAFFKVQNAVMKGGIRSDEATELVGLDIPEMGAMAYPEFVELDVVAMRIGGISPTNEEPDPDKAPV